MKGMKRPIPGRRDVTQTELPFLELPPADIFALGDKLRDDGHASPTVAGLEAWLLRKALGQPDRTAQPTRAKYRRILATISAPPPKRRRRQKGYANLAVPAGVTAAGLAHAGGADLVASTLVGLYVTYSGGEPLPEAA
jgi:hypothetical protein